MARRLLLLLIAATAGTGCKNVAGPFEARNKPKPDAPGYSVEEQQRRSRDKYATFEDDRRVAPPAFADRPSPIGR